MFSNIKAAKLLGWTSLAVGATEVLAPGWVQSELGVAGHKMVIRAFGLREIAAGAMILSQPGLNRTLASALWGRVAGDAADVAALGKAAQVTRNPRGLSAITSIVLAITGIDIVVAVLIQRDLLNADRVSRQARQRVHPTAALPRRGEYSAVSST